MMKTESISAQNRESLRQLRRRLVREQRAVSIRKFFRNKLSVVGMVLVLLMLICAVFAPLITGLLGVDPYTATMQERFQAPSAAHLFGTDNLGRDIFARVLYGAQISMTVGFTVGLLSDWHGAGAVRLRQQGAGQCADAPVRRLEGDSEHSAGDYADGGLGREHEECHHFLDHR